MPVSSKNTQRIPLVTIITPCHNYARYLGRCIEGVREQDYPALHWVFCDDGSSDDSSQVVVGKLDEYEELDNMVVGILNRKDLPPVKVFVIRNEQPMGGPSPVRNKCMNAASQHTDYFCPLDADDWYLPGKITESVKIAEKDPERIGLVYSDVLIYNEKTRNITHEFRQPYHRGALERECIISNAPLINRKAIEKCGGYDVSMRTAEDWHLWLRITQHFIAIHIPQPLQCYRVTGENASDTVNKEVWNENWRKVAALIKQQHNQ